ncbi:MAG: nitronate monooxygenase [Proteobacteria bacterium]|nr:nitronate monooxygenase [Pseudomonadota bacterium]
MNSKPYFQHLWQRGCDYLGAPKAIMGGAMTWVSERHLVSALSNAGAFGVLACGAMKPDMLRAEIQETKKLTQKPFGVNLIVMHPELEALAQVCVDEKVPHVVLAGGLPPAAVVSKLKAGGTKVMAFAPALVIAKKLLRSNIDALVIEGSEAGGHIGPVSTFVLAQEILPEIKDVPVFAAGGIGRGEGILALLEMGAAGVQLGTRFVCAKECIAHAKFKQAFIRGAARDAQPSVQLDPRFPVIPVRALMNNGTRHFTEKQREVMSRFETGAVEQKAAQLEIEHFWAGALRRAVMEGDVAEGSLMAGQSVGMVDKEQPVTVILDELIGQALAALEKRNLPK